MQPRLPHTNVGRGHANLGEQFQSIIDLANRYYSSRGVADIDRNELVWKTTTAAKWHATAPQRRSVTEYAVRGERRVIHRIAIPSNVDYTGGGENFSVAFDAKQTASTNFPLENVTPEQVETLWRKSRCGVRAGLLVFFTGAHEVFWVPAGPLRLAHDLARHQGKGRGEHPKSLSLVWCRENGRRAAWGLGGYKSDLDYLPATAPELFTDDRF